MLFVTLFQALERQIEDRREDVAKVHKFEETMRNAAVEVLFSMTCLCMLQFVDRFLCAYMCCAQLSEKESRLADVQSRLGMLLERSRLAEERAASSELRLQCIQDKIDSKVKDNAAMEQRRKDNLGAWLLAMTFLWLSHPATFSLQKMKRLYFLEKKMSQSRSEV